MDARRVTAVLAADAELDVGARFAPAFGREVDQLPDAFDVEADERVGQEDALVDILRQEAARIVAADADRRLRQVVGAEREKLRRLGNLARHQRGARQFDHRSDQIGDLAPLFGEHRLGLAIYDRFHQVELAARRHQRDHYLGNRRGAGFGGDVARRLENRARLHLIDFGIGDAEAAAAMAEHRVELVQLVRARLQRLDPHPRGRGDANGRATWRERMGTYV